MASITLKGREIPLLYTTLEMKTIQENIAPISEAIDMIIGKNPKDESDENYSTSSERIGALAKTVMILGNAALEEAGKETDLTDRKILRMMKPSRIVEVANACLDAMNEGMESEIPKEKKEGPVDVTLEEMEKKKETET
jgi:hypothetical protein